MGRANLSEQEPRKGYHLSDRSRQKLEGVHPKLVAVVERAVSITTQDFLVFCGARSLNEQKELYKLGKSRTLTSRHLVQPDGYAHAVDLVAWSTGMRWSPSDLYYQIARAMRTSAETEGVEVTWGGAWDRKMSALDPEKLPDELYAYSDRHFRKTNRRPLVDLVHFQLEI